MKGQGGGRLSRLFAGFAILFFALGCGTGILAGFKDAPSLWRIADLFFDFALLITMLVRGPSLIKG